MPEQTATKPYQSKRQARWAHATHQPFARRWDKLTRFRGLPERKDAGTDAGAHAHGPGGLLSTPGLGGGRKRKGRKWGLKLKEGYTARAGETIRGNLGRSQTGQFTRVGAPSSDAPPQFGKGAKKPKKGKGRKAPRAPKAKITPEQRASATQTKRAQNRAAVFSQLGLYEDATAALTDLRDGKPVADDGGLVKLGLAEQATDGSYRMTPTGRAFLAAADAGDAGRARDTLSRGTDAQGTRTQRQQERTQRQQASAAKRTAREQATAARREAVAARRVEAAKKKPGKKQPAKAEPEKKPARRVAPLRSSHAGGGSGGGSSSSSAAPKPKPAPAPAKAPAKQISPVLTEAATAVSEGTDVTPAQIQQLVTNGLVKLDKDGKPILTAAGLRATMKAFTFKQTAQDRAMFANMGGGGGSGGSGGGSGGNPSGGQGGLWEKGPSGKRTPQAGLAAPAKPAPKRKAKPKAKPKTSPKVKREIGNLEAQKRYIESAPHRANDPMHQASLKRINARLTELQKSKSFAVYKDHTGALRWIARTTTAYKDRDGEIISEAALDADSSRMMESKAFGPLRWWHTGAPDPLRDTNPWGPGLDIGDCDYSAVIGRTRVESGTFRDETIARKIAATADRFEMSPGFFHPLDQPDAAGVFHTIRTFERSIVPVRYGRASNLFTGFTVKEFRMEVDEMERRFKAMYQELGLTPEQGQALGEQLLATEKAAEAQGIAYKDAEAEMAYPDLEINGVVYKAAMPPMAMDAEDDPALGGDSGVDEAAEGEPPMDAQPEGDYIGDMAVEDFKTMLAELLAPVLKMQDMVKSIGDAHAELKGMYGGVAQKDDARATELAALKASLADVTAKIAQIEGDQPATVLPDEVAEALKSAGPEQAQEPAKPQIESTPERPWRGWGAMTFPELYQNGENA